MSDGLVKILLTLAALHEADARKQAQTLRQLAAWVADHTGDGVDPEARLDSAAVEAVFGIKPKPLRKLIRSGRLAAVRVGRSYLVKRADVVALLDAHRVAQRAAPNGETTAPAATSLREHVRGVVREQLSAGKLHTLPCGKGAKK